MIEDSTNFYEIEEKFLVVLDSAIPTEIGNYQSVQGADKYKYLNNVYTNKSDLIFDLQKPITKSLEDIQLKCSVKNAVFPNSQYIINNTNNYFAICLIDDSDTPILGTNLLIELPQGNYNTESLSNELLQTISTAYSNIGIGVATILWQVNYSFKTCKYTISFTSPNPYYKNFYISFQPKDLGTRTSVSQLGSVIGFSNDFVYISGNMVEALNDNAIFSEENRIIEANFPSNLSGLRSFNVILKNYNTSSIPIRPYNSEFGFKNSIINSNFNNGLYNDHSRENIICNVLCNANPMEYIFYEKSSDFYIDLKEPFLSRIHIQLTDTYGNLLQLNGQDWSMTLEFSLLKKKDFKTKSFYEYLLNT